MRFRRRMGRRMKRRTAWVPGVNFGEAVGFATLTLADLGPGSTTNGITLQLTDANDLRNAGGEDAVVARILANVWFYRTLNDVTPVQRFLRWAFFRAVDTPATASATNPVSPPDLWTANALGYEDILQMGQVFVPSVDALAPASAIEASFNYTQESCRLMEDISVKRKLQEDCQLYFTVQAAPVAGVTVTTVSCSGYIRLLLMGARR